jgi:hypothetical protein
MFGELPRGAELAEFVGRDGLPLFCPPPWAPWDGAGPLLHSRTAVAPGSMGPHG